MLHVKQSVLFGGKGSEMTAFSQSAGMAVHRHASVVHVITVAQDATLWLNMGQQYS